MHPNLDAAAQAAGQAGPVPPANNIPHGQRGHEARVSQLAGGQPEPMTPPEMDLRGLPFMPLDVNRLRDSGLAIEATGEEFRAAILLWCACWNQIPAASLPDSDSTLAQYAGFGRDIRSWKKVKKGALRGFVQCNDGRFYHPVVAEKAHEAWTERLEYREIRENERLRKERERKDRSEMFAKLREYGHVLPHNTPTSKLREHLAEIEGGRCTSQGHAKTGHAVVTVTGHAGDTAKKGQGQGQGQGQRRDRDSDAFKAVRSSNNTSADKYQGVATAMARVLREMGWSECADGHPQLIEAAKAGVTVDAIRQAAVGKAGKPLSYVTKRAIGQANDARESVAELQGVVVSDEERIGAAERAEVERLKRGLEDKIITAQNDHKLGLITGDQRDERIAGYREALAGLVGMGAQA